MSNEMQAILTLNGKQYSVLAPAGWVLEPSDIEQVKDILIGKISTLNPATCPDVIQGTTHAVTLTATGGVPNYTYRLLLDGSQIATAGPIADTSQTFNYTFDQAVGAHILKGEITDSCSTPQTSSDQCTIFNIIAPCPPITSCSISTCPPSSIVQGTDISLVVSWAGGTPVYSVQLFRDGDNYGSPVAVSGTSAVINVIVDTSWTVGSHAVSVMIIDSCSEFGATPQTCTTAACTVNVIAPCAALGITMNIV